MCDPITIAATATAVSTAASVGGQIVQHNSQKDAAKENERNSLAAFVENVRALNLRGIQETADASQYIDQATTQSQQEHGLAAVGAAEAGVSGNSVDAQKQVLDRGLASYKDSTLVNLDRMLSQIELEKKGAATTAQSRINQVQAPSVLGTALGAVGTAASGLNDILIRRPKAGK